MFTIEKGPLIEDLEYKLPAFKKMFDLDIVLPLNEIEKSNICSLYIGAVQRNKAKRVYGQSFLISEIDRENNNYSFSQHY